MLAEIKPAIRATEYTGERSGENAEFVDLVAANNVRHSMAQIREDSEVLAKLEKDGNLRIVGAIYHLGDGRLELLD
ncbi:carbonic anhydrase [Microbulbifer taiwanensis]|uniref:carbonic anhydrase n=1 Tax=Microbulbifer taiwanensis TaxID=986746 RepID=UPI00361D28B5